jgi:hypothetical protein
VIVFVLLAAAGFGIYSFVRSVRTAPFGDFTITQVTNSGNGVLAAVFPEGRYLLSVICRFDGEEIGAVMDMEKSRTFGQMELNPQESQIVTSFRSFHYGEVGVRQTALAGT